MNKRIIWILVIFAILYMIISLVSNFFIDYEWFRINDGLSIFWVLFFTKFNVHAFFGVIFVALFFFNFLLIRLLGGKGRIFTHNILSKLHIPILGSPKRALFIILTAGVIVVGFMMGGAASAFWKEYLLYTNAVPFEGFPPDPIFNLDIGFYVFSLPFYQFLYGWLMSAFIIIALFSLAFHVLNGGILFSEGKIEFSLFSRAHISTLLAIIVLIYGVGYRLSAYELLFSKIGKFYGAGYTAVHANLLAYNVAMVISFIAAGLFLFNIFKRSFKLPIFVLIALIPAYFILGTIFPSLQQRFVVEPNELDKEKPYILNNIKYTRIAYGIDKVKEIPFANDKTLTARDIARNRTTIENVRLWDWRPLKQTYRQLQELKPYYFFNDVDVDRYMIDGKKIAVNLSARELSIDQLGRNSQTWQNKHLIYTHGYGMVLSRVDKITSEGLPEMLIYDIPPKSLIDDIQVDRPEVYYGEHKNEYVITNTTIKPGEFDYPAGNENKYTRYEGTGGSQLDSFLKRVIFASAFKDVNIFISGSINDKSRLLFRRNIVQMVTTFTPFLEFDSDPYLVLSEGKMYWIIDAYTTTDQFPYSTPISMGGRKLNYIRNSIKVVIDAYNGNMSYYISDQQDPVIKTYSRIFPGIFKDMESMPEDLKNHIRYPESIFNVQAQMLLRYHMQDPNVFYNNEDLWEVPNQIYESTEVPVHSYYFVTGLPDEEGADFILILPFTPYKKNNMIAFLVAKCDTHDYGTLKLYTLPKEKLSYGPLQIEARIDQDAEISKQLTLWSQKGSGVIRGNMLAIPIEESILYIEPLYLKAESSEMPELNRVIVSFADKIGMETDLASARERLFYGGGTFIDESSYATEEPLGARIKNLANKAYNHYNRAQQSIRAGNWEEFGRELDNLKQVLEVMKNLK